MQTIKVNGRKYSVDVEDDMLLLWVIREVLGFFGTKFGCGKALCGACSVHIDGQIIRSCMYPVSAAAGKKITTIEGIGAGIGKIVQEAWIEHDVPQCGYCQSGQIMAAVSLLKNKPKPTDADIDQAMVNICRCGTYQRMREAIHAASARLVKGGAA